MFPVDISVFLHLTGFTFHYNILHIALLHSVLSLLKLFSEKDKDDIVHTVMKLTLTSTFQ